MACRSDRLEQAVGAEEAVRLAVRVGPLCSEISWVGRHSIMRMARIRGEDKAG